MTLRPKTINFNWAKYYGNYRIFIYFLFLRASSAQPPSFRACGGTSLSSDVRVLSFFGEARRPFLGAYKTILFIKIFSKIFYQTLVLREISISSSQCISWPMDRSMLPRQPFFKISNNKLTIMPTVNKFDFPYASPNTFWSSQTFGFFLDSHLFKKHYF